ncbi:protein of unknown function UPF0153 [Desulfarculus baarsii DSM 2075]|uniref:Flagellin N-methylase n=1 Tax=Desulfarculus baarsii (strain ATCC 33931 / DSM 2075 / LMG 7858 / VKM B-1802 / 2st14) TaxID=644282 RepID=E1QKD2_DESB2|nr:YkgJ family cysteine cluster protein [Desulfarculus baarsii]ADK86025.1 protein of unknown function UPF0153 [Desulfarculus baarsii DSM 2075]
MDRAKTLQAIATALDAGPTAALAACAEALMRLRPMAADGAQRLCRPLLAAGLGAAALLERLESLAVRQACLGCATCCQASSPTLYLADLALLGPDGPGRGHFYTLRAGEMVSSARLGSRQALVAELIKIREAPGGGCVFLEPGGGCAIYDRRPLQCRNLECWSGRDASTLALKPRLGRAEILCDDDTALTLAAEYDVKLPAAELTQALEQAKAGSQVAAAAALQMIELDHRLRGAISRRYGYDAPALELIIGRAAQVVARAHGLALGLDRLGRPRLERLHFGPA